MWKQLRALFTAGPSPGYLPEFIRQPPDEMKSESAPDWLLEWHGWLLPHGGGFRGRLSLTKGTTPTIAHVEYPIDRNRPSIPKQVPLSESAENRLRLVLQEAFPDQLYTVPEACFDGIPFEVIVHRRKPYLGLHARCNLGDRLGLLPTWDDSLGESHDGLANHAFKADKPVSSVYLLGFVLLDTTLPETRKEDR